MKRCRIWNPFLAPIRSESVLEKVNMKVLCGMWVQNNATVAFRIFEDDNRYFIEYRFGNRINNFVRCYAHPLCQDEEGNIHVEALRHAIGYDCKRDLLLVEYFGAYKRFIQQHDAQ